MAFSNSIEGWAILTSSNLDPAAVKLMSLTPLRDAAATPDPRNSRFVDNDFYPQG